MDDLTVLAQVLRVRNEIDGIIAAVIGRPAEKGHIGEYIASRVFGIDLYGDATRVGSDGTFRGDPARGNPDPLTGKSVDVKFYGKQEDMLNVNLNSLPAYYLVMTGTTAPAVPSQGKTRPSVIEHVYLLDAEEVADDIVRRGVKDGVAASIPKSDWQRAEIYPTPTNQTLVLSENQTRMLKQFSESGGNDESDDRSG